MVPPVPHLSSHAYLLENTCLECIYLLSYVSERIICEMFSIQICHSATFTQANEYEFWVVLTAKSNNAWRRRRLMNYLYSINFQGLETEFIISSNEIRACNHIPWVHDGMTCRSILLSVLRLEKGGEGVTMHSYRDHRNSKPMMGPSKGDPKLIGAYHPTLGRKGNGQIMRFKRERGASALLEPMAAWEPIQWE